MINSSISLDVSRNRSTDYIFAKQLDNKTRFLNIELNDDGEKYTPESGCHAVFRGLKPDNHSFMNDAIIENDGTITIELTDQVLAAPGKVECDISLIKGEKILSSASFNIIVHRIPVNGNEAASSNEFTYLIGVTREIKDMTVSAHGLSMDELPTATKTGGDGAPIHLDFGIPVNTDSVAGIVDESTGIVYKLGINNGNIFIEQLFT